jgi:hypothetical protein
MKLKSFLLGCAIFAAAVGSVSAQTIFQIGTATGTGGTNSFPAGEAPRFAIDGNNGTKYLNFAELNTGYIYTPTSGGSFIVTGINFVTANDAPDRDPASYQLFGSNTAVASNVPGTTYNVDTQFTLISQGALALSTTRGSIEGGSVTFANTQSYSTFLLVFPTVRNAAGANSMQIAEAVLQTANGGLTSTDPNALIGGGQLQVVPEPSTIGLLGLATAGIAAMRRRRK